MAARLRRGPRRPPPARGLLRGARARGCRGGPRCPPWAANAASAASSPPRRRRRGRGGQSDGGGQPAGAPEGLPSAPHRPLRPERGPARPPPLRRCVGARRRRHSRGPLCTYATSSPPALPARQAGGAAPPGGRGRAAAAAERSGAPWPGRLVGGTSVEAGGRTRPPSGACAASSAADPRRRGRRDALLGRCLRSGLHGTPRRPRAPSFVSPAASWLPRCLWDERRACGPTAGEAGAPS